MLDINWTLLLQIVNVLILIFILQRLLFKPITKVLDEREARIRGPLEEAKNVQEKAEKALKIIEDELVQARQKAAAILSEVRREGMAEQIKIVEAAKEIERDMIAKAAKEIEKEADKAKKILRKDAEIIASEIAVKILK
ncbi:MAG: ATP synthase F0 subunit B [Nitrospirae bacterium]|nr:ATP synthase F0 subunit B [Nitrospirota bacterium]